MDKRGLKALVKATPLAGKVVEVQVDGGVIEIDARPIAVMEILALADRYPEVKDVIISMLLGEMDPKDVRKAIQLLLDQVPRFVFELLAIGCGEKGNQELIDQLMTRPDAELMAIADAIIEATAPEGQDSFFGRFLGTASARGWFKNRSPKGSQETSPTTP